MRTTLIAIFLVVMSGVLSPLGAAKLPKVETGKNLPSLIKGALKELMKDAPKIEGLSEGFSVTAENIIVVERYEDLKILLPEAAEFAQTNRLLLVVVNHQFPFYLIKENPEYRNLEQIAAAGAETAAASVLESHFGHEVDHVYFKPPEGLSPEESEKVRELHGSEMQMAVLRLKIAQGKTEGLRPDELLAVPQLDIDRLKAQSGIKGFALIGQK